MSNIVGALVQRQHQAPRLTLEVLTGFVLTIRAYSFNLFLSALGIGVFG